MKKIHIKSVMIALFCGITSASYSQNVAINATGNQADPSAMLDVSSQTAGVLIPRMNTASRNAISHPATGLQVFNTDCDELNYWSGTCWISLGALPSPGPITSNSSTALCAAVTANYSVPAVMGATKYIWSVPAGATINSGQATTSISVTLGNYSGQICVIASDTCESSNQVCIDINVSPIPPTPGNITGLASVNPGQNLVTYFIASVTGAGVYNWSVPSGASITAGVGTPAITVDFSCSAVSGNVSVTAGSNCGTSSPAALFVTLTPLSVNAGSAVFGGTAIGGSPTASGGQSPYTYSWSPNSNLSSSTVANPTALCSGSTTTYTVTVTDLNGCSATSSVAVTRNLTANAGSAVFGGGTLSASATGGVSPYAYSWSPNNNLSGYTVSNPTALCSGSTTTYTLTVTDSHGCTATSGVVVTRNLAANAGSAIFGGATLNGSATGGVSPYAYSWSPNSNLAGYAVANPASLCSGSTTTYTLNVTDANGCTSTSSVVVTRNLAASAGSNVSTCTSATIGGSPTASGGNSSSYSYSWNPTTNLSSSTIANPTASASNTGYTITVTDANGCTATSSMSVSVSSGTHGSQTFNYTGSQQTFTAGSCITSVTIQVWGAQGGNSGGLGGYATGNLTGLTTGTILYVNVGGTTGNSSGGFNGGGSAGSPNPGYGGGGGSDVRTINGNWNSIVIDAGGGGGWGFTSTGGPSGGTAGDGGSAGNQGGAGGGVSPSYGGGGGGGGGAISGANGTAGGSGNYAGGAGGTGSATGGNPGLGGAGYYVNGSSGTTGSQGQGGTGGGGAGSGCGGGGGGGGGGYYGGGGGGGGGAHTSCSGGSGGGGGSGSNYIGGVSNGSTSNGQQSGNGVIIITY